MITRNITSKCTTTDKSGKINNCHKYAMDSLSKELNDFLVKLGKEPGCAGERVEHNVKHIMHLLDKDGESVLQQYYGLFGSMVKPVEDIAAEHGTDSAGMLREIEICLRKIAVSPEWQIVKQQIS